ncbi:MAG: pyridoxamine 5'-phosphate oxidase family protein [Phycisphaerae bacterium]|jgi:hypothetical protein|nr:pyridoxamine 5'-phosphate oxidase family protein [Phycisphaerae bacterium]
MRRVDRKISDSEAGAILESAEYGVLSTAMDNEPYGIPVNFTCENGCIYIHCAIEGRKLDFIANNNDVSFCAVGATELLPSEFATKYESVVVSGVASIVDDEEKTIGLKSLVRKYSPEHMERGLQYIEKLFDQTCVIKITPMSITGKARR